MGMPGAGKTVQSHKVRDELGFHWLSTGQMLRESQDPEVLRVQATGALVDDELVTRIVGENLKKEGYDKTFLLDGFPRNAQQAQWLVEHGEDVGKHIRAVLFLDVDEEVATERLGGRGRDDDNHEALAKRREEQQKLEPMLAYLRSINVPIETIDANRSVEEIFESIKTALSKYVTIKAK